MSVFEFEVTEVNIYNEELRRYLNTSSGDLWKYIEKKGLLALAGARRQVGVRTGALRRNIRWFHVGNYTGQYAGLIADKHYALLHHEGTRPHIITPTTATALVFPGRSGRIIRTHLVRHPGTKPNHYLSDQLIHFRG